MASTYQLAYQHALATRQRDPWYPLVIRLAALVSASWQAPPDPQQRSEIADTLRDVRAVAAELQPAALSFWELSFLVDAKLMDALVGDLLAQSRADLVARYRSAERRGASAREMDSVVSRLRFLRLMAVSEKPDIAAELGALVQALQA